MDIPTFAIIGHPNEGKTTLIATLAEEDSAKISPIPGTTTKSAPFKVKIDGKAVLQFVDTPGFQRPKATLEWFKTHEAGVVSLAKAFLAANRDSAFDHEREIMKPIAEGAAVIYVIDGSRPVRQVDREEMEILCLVNQPRIAVINSKQGSDKYTAKWKEELKAFGPVRVFNAHQATFRDRMDLLRVIRGVIQDWEGVLDQAIAAFQDDWEKRIRDSAELVCDLLKTTMSRCEVESLPAGANKKKARQRAEERLKIAIREDEEKFRVKVRDHFKHRRITGLAHDSLLVEELFSEEVVRVFGLSKHQLAVTSAAICAMFAAAGDLIAHGTSLGLCAAIGGGVGYVVGYLGANRLVSVEMPTRLRPFLPNHGRCVKAKPQPLSNLPWILLGRAMEFFHWASTWPHGRRDEPVKTEKEGEKLPSWHVKNWSEKQREAAADYIALVLASKEPGMLDKILEFFRKKKKDPETIEANMEEMLIKSMKEMTGFQR